MDYREVHYKLLKWMQGKLDKETFHSTKTELQSIDPLLLSEAMESVWNEHTDSITMNQQDKLQMLLSLNEEARKKRKGRRSWLKVAAIAIPITFLGASLIFYSLQNNKPEEIFTVKTERGEKSNIQLPDGTVIYLNRDSKLAYSSDYNKKNRSVSLKGGGYFEVAKKKDMEFKVQVNDIEVVVKGTKFDIDANNQNNIIVSLVEGKVNIYDKSQQLLAALSPNEVAYIDADSKVNIRKENASTHTIWVQNKLILNNADIHEITEKLEYWYAVNIKNTVTNKDKYTLTIKTESLRETLELLNMLTPIRYQINGEEVTMQDK